jgi:hypothetical protein
VINFCHIVPTAYLSEYTKRNGAHLILAHLVESDPAYRDFYANLGYDKPKIMDNGAFEMFKAGRPMYDSDKLIEMAKACKADYVVMSDYPKQPAAKTMRAATDSMNKLLGEGFVPFFCPQSSLDDLNGLLDSIEWAIDELRIGLIGLSILNAPVALGLEEKTHFDPKTDDGYKMQRFLSRWKLFREMEKRGILAQLSKINSTGGLSGKRSSTKVFHMLGMVDGPNEIDLVREYHKYIFSWDSSAAVWAGLNGIEFDKSPTGLRNGKFELEVNFADAGRPESMLVHRNIAYINRLCEGK